MVPWWKYCDQVVAAAVKEEMVAWLELCEAMEIPVDSLAGLNLHHPLSPEMEGLMEKLALPYFDLT
jgi:hypothetical protein